LEGKVRQRHNNEAPPSRSINVYMLDILLS
jgi:hypothetical protein